MRRFIVGGNWKCNGTKDFAKNFSQNTLKTLQFNKDKVEVVVAPSFLHMGTAQEALEGSNVQLST